MSNKVYAGATGEGPTLVTSPGPSIAQHPRRSYKPRHKSPKHRHRLQRVWSFTHHRVFEPVERSYKRLSLTTRQTIRVAISLFAVLYIFLTVPFRIAFYFDPFRDAEDLHKRQWTTELSVYAATDAAADLIGVLEFLQFYRLKARGTTQFVSFRRVSTRGGNLRQPPKITRALSFDVRRQEETKWTLASIEGSSSTSVASISHRDIARTRNIEFVLEIVAVVPVEVILYAAGAYNALHFVRITKLCRLYRLQYCIERIATIYSDRALVQYLSSAGIKNLARDIGLYAGLCHWFACGYMFVAHAHCGLSLVACRERESSWVITDRLVGASVARKYARSLYWASRTVLLMGYDELAPVSDTETIYVILVTIMGGLFASSLLASFLFIFRFWNARYAAFSTHVDNAREYMRSQNIPRALRRQVIAYFSYSWNTHHSLDSEEALHLMPKHLQAKVVSTLKASRVKQVCFLAKESIEFINLLAVALLRQVYSPADQIIEPQFNAQMFFVIRGRVVLSAFNGSKPKECQTGDFFADVCLLFPERFEEKAVAKTFCELYVLPKIKFDEAVAEYYRETESEVRSRMAETLEKYLAQLLKTKKLLGMRGRAGSARNSHGGSTHNMISAEDTQSASSRRRVSWRLPGSAFRVYWDVARLLAIIYVAFEVPYVAVFTSSGEEQHMLLARPGIDFRYSLTLLIEMFFGVNLVLRSRFLAHLDPIVMLVIEDPGLIFATYKANGFYLDLIACLPVGVLLDSCTAASVQKYSWPFRLLRLLRLREVPDLLWNSCDYYGVSSKTHLVVSLLLGVTFTLHVVGCIWFEMAWVPGTEFDQADKTVLWELTRLECLEHATMFTNCSWVIYDCYAHIGEVFPSEDPASMYQASFAYLRSVYWAIVTLTTVGYGDITAYSTGESLFAAFWVYVGGIINFAVIGAMSSTISSAIAPQRQHIEKLNTINTILERVGISTKLSSEIRRFYHLEFTGRKQAYESQLLSNLPDRLCYEISSLLHSEAVKSVELFDSATIEFLKEVTGKFRHQSYQNGETICLEGDVCREFFVLLRGSKVNVFFRSRKAPIRALHEGDCYGVNEFLLRRAHLATLTAASVVNASVMTREQFDGIQRKFDEDLHDMKEEAQTLLMEQHKRMLCIVRNLERLKLQPHMMSTSSLFYQGEAALSTISAASGRNENFVGDIYATRSTLTSLWKAIITCWSVYNAVFIVFRVSFHSHLDFAIAASAAVWVADLGCDFCFAVDIYLRLYYFGCSEVNLDNLVTRKWRDRKYFRSSRFKWDLLTSLPIYTPFASDSLIAGLCRVPRLVRCVDLWTYLDDVIVQIQQYFASHNVSAYLSPAKLMIILVLVAHYVGCIFFWISEHECDRIERCWIAHDRVLGESRYSTAMLYAKSFYWAITTLLLAGSREILPRNTAATLWASFTCLCCTFIVGHIVGEFSDLIQELSKEAKQYKNRIASFDSFAKNHKLPEGLRARVGFFFREQLKHAKDSDFYSTVQDLSANLRLKLTLEIYGDSILLLPISRFFTSTQVNNLALRLRSELFIPGDNILVEGTLGNRLCILRRGTAAVFWTSSMTSVAVLLEGAMFGEVAFFLTGQRRLATVRATTSCEVLYLTKYEWQELWMANGDLSDAQVQKHAQHAVLDWVKSRIRRYQRFSLNTANKVKRLLATRSVPQRLVSTVVATAATVQAKRKFSALVLNRKESNESIITIRPAPRALQSPLLGAIVLSPASELQLLERKAEYLHAKTDECLKMLRHSTAVFSAQRRSASAVSSRSFRGSASLNNGPSLRFYRSFVGDAVAPLVRIKSTASDIQMMQFMFDTNPVDKRVRESLSDDHLHHMEAECWARFKLLMAAQYGITKLLGTFAPFEATFKRAPTKSSELHPNSAKQETLAKNPARKGVRRLRSLIYDEYADRKQEIERLVMAASNVTKPTDQGTAKKWKALAVAAAPKLKLVLSEVLGKSGGLPSVIAQGHFQQNRHPPSERGPRPGRMQRCQSLPNFGREFFEGLHQRDDSHFVGSCVQTGLDFELLQRCHHPPRAVKLRLFHQYRKGKDRSQASVFSKLENSILSQMSRRNLHAAPVQTTSTPTNGKSAGSSVKRSTMQLLHQQVVDAAAKGCTAVITLAKRLGKTWDLIMLLIAVYHLEITTFKVCFSVDITELSDSLLRYWSGFEIFIDILCVLDLSYKCRFEAKAHQNGVSTKRQPETKSSPTNDPVLRADIIAMLPFELLLIVTDVRVPLDYMPATANTAEASWWTTRSFLRMNRLLLIRRIEPLSEKLLQFVIQDRKVPVNEALLDFIRGLATYLTMGHLLACIWFLVSKLSDIVTNEVPAAVDDEQTARMLKTTTYVGGTSLLQKYLGALLFAMDCISTLFYGDILSMNPVDVVVELGITLWSIYIYGALVGAQGELFDARARRETAFEQKLGQLQHYLVQNEVSTEIKQQVKTYYARLWRLRKGDAEFAPIETVSRVLYEDVVLATLQTFAGKVTVFRSLDDQFLRALLVCLQYVVCSESEEVFVIGDMDRSMYFIAQGRVLVKMGSSESTRERGEFFGELALLYGISRLETCVTITVTELYRLDHEPYERLLLEFPEYRARNKLAWTTFSSGSVRDRSIMEEALRCFRQVGRLGGVHPSTSKVEGSASEVLLIANAEALGVTVDRIEAHVPYSHIYRSTMTLLAQLSRVDPLEVKELILKSREGARRQLKTVLRVATARADAEDDVVHSFHSRSPSPTTREDDKEKNNDVVQRLEAGVVDLSTPAGETKTEGKLFRRAPIVLQNRRESIRDSISLHTEGT